MRYDASGRDNSYATFDSSGSPFHPMCALNNLLFIGDGSSLARFDTGGNYSSEVIALQAHMDMSCIKPYGYDIAIFTYVAQSFLRAGVFRYDTASIAWSSEDYIEEAGINVAISSNTSDELFILAGSNGDIYQFDGVKMQWIAKIKGATSVTTNNRLSAALGRKSYFSTGNGIVYSLSHPIPGGKAVLNKEFTVSAGVTAIIYSMCVYGNQLLVAWGHTTGGVTTYGIDKIDTNYAIATLDTGSEFVRARTIKVYYESLPTGTSIDIGYKNDNGSWVVKTMSSGDVVKDDKNKCVYLKSEPGNIRSIQARAILNPNNTGTPVTPIIQGISIEPY
jgi:hypothetical protein